MKILVWLTLILIALVVVMLARSPIEPVVWTPAPNPGLTGPFMPNDVLSAARQLLNGAGPKPEDVTRGPDGWFYTGFEDGRIVRFADDGSNRYDEIVNTSGRPLGMQFDSRGNLIVADAARGLLSVSPAGVITVLSDSVAGTNFSFADDLDIAADGTVWFSEASQRFDYRHYLYDFLEASATGRLLSYSPHTGETTVRMENLYFANGVALGPDDRFVLVTETGTGRIHRLWLKGPDAGSRDLFFDALPGNPDNISFNGRDTFWVAMPAVRIAATEKLAAIPLLRKLLGAFAIEALLKSRQYGFVAGLSLDGTVRHSFQSPDGTLHAITSVNEFGDALYLGSIGLNAVSVLPAPR